MKDADRIENKIPDHHSKGYCNEDGPAGGRQAGDRGEGWRDRADACLLYTSSGAGAAGREKVCPNAVTRYARVHAPVYLSLIHISLRALGVENREHVLVVGDGLSSDIQGGVNAGLDTCWYNPCLLYTSRCV